LVIAWFKDWSSILPSELLPQLEDILSESRVDFTTGPQRNFCEEDITQILERAKRELWAKLEQTPIHTSTELAQAWNEVVTDFYAQKYWGFLPGRAAAASVAPKAGDELGNQPSNELIPYLRTFILPTLFLKIAILYFGLEYSSYPGQGYGWGLLAAVVASLANFGFFLWKTRNSPEA
jgi:hypothetical protein